MRNERTGTRLGECTGAADHAGIGQRIAAVEHQRGVVGNVTGDAASGARIAELQRPGADRRPTGVLRDKAPHQDPTPIWIGPCSGSRHTEWLCQELRTTVFARCA